jgi:predicted  nucleic acid-binding Zn-ribbon protein
MRKQSNWFPLYGDENCIEIVLKGTWTATKKGKIFCQRHGAMLATCERCGKRFHSERGHTKTCSNACRKALSRAKRLQIESVT